MWRESDKSLTLLSKDYEPCEVFAAGIISRGGKVFYLSYHINISQSRYILHCSFFDNAFQGAMSFVCHDDRQNLQFFQYAPGDAAARGGNKLVCRADFHLGAQTTSFQSHCELCHLFHLFCLVMINFMFRSLLFILQGPSLACCSTLALFPVLCHL